MAGSTEQKPSERREKLAEDVQGGINLINAQAMLGVDIDASGLSAEAISLLKASQSKIEAMGAVDLKSMSDEELDSLRRSLYQDEGKDLYNLRSGLWDVREGVIGQDRTDALREMGSSLTAEDTYVSTDGKIYAFDSNELVYDPSKDEGDSWYKSRLLAAREADETLDKIDSFDSREALISQIDTEDYGRRIAAREAEQNPAEPLTAEMPDEGGAPSPPPAPPSPPPAQTPDTSTPPPATKKNNREHSADKNAARREAMLNARSGQSAAEAELNAARQNQGSGRPFAYSALNLNDPPPLDAKNRPEPGRQIKGVDVDNAANFADAADRFGNSVADALDAAARLLLQHAGRIERIELMLEEAQR
jgi:hypothetical protein